MVEIEKLKFDENGLIPAVIVDSVTKKVLTLAYMNKESLKISMEKGLTCFYSRSRQELWLKGETSGNYQHIVSITADCDNDALTALNEGAMEIQSRLDAAESEIENCRNISVEIKREIASMRAQIDAAKTAFAQL